MERFDVCVQGSGPVGMSLALALSRQGLAVAWRGPAPAGALASDVRTYALGASSVALLEGLGVWPALAADARTAVRDMEVHGDAHASGLHFSALDQDLPALAWIVDAAELERVLLDALRDTPRLVRVEREMPAALQALAEGRDAAGRRARGVEMQVHRYGQKAVATRLVADRPHGGLARQWFRAPDVLALLPFDRPTVGHGYGLVWSVPDAQADELMAMDEAAFEAALAAATGGAAGTLRLAGPRAAWPLIYAQADRLCGAGWVLLGDAAHVVHPLAGQGLNLGLADVKALAEVLAARESFRALGDERLLRRYARERHMPVRAMGQLTDGLLELFAHPHPVARELRNRGLTLLNVLPPIKRFLTERALRS
jgi:2-polyprenyl-6-methoxyphenol hydroxylase-like FAD-dependent oxidoreductase